MEIFNFLEACKYSLQLHSSRPFARVRGVLETIHNITLNNENYSFTCQASNVPNLGRREPPQHVNACPSGAPGSSACPSTLAPPINLFENMLHGREGGSTTDENAILFVWNSLSIRRDDLLQLRNSSGGDEDWIMHVLELDLNAHLCPR